MGSLQCLVEVLKYVANIPLSGLIHRGLIFRVGVSGLYSELHGIISNDWGSHFFLGYCDWRVTNLGSQYLPLHQDRFQNS